MHKEKIKTFLKNHIIILAFICFIILFSILFLYKNWNICYSIFDTIQICYKEKISNKILRFWNISFLKGTEINDYSGNALSIICGIIVGIPAFLLPLFFSVFDSKIKNLTANQEFHFQKMIEKNNIKGFYTLIFIFIIYLFLQNYFTFLNWGNLTYFINIIFTIGFIDKTYNILNNLIFIDTRELIINNYKDLINKNIEQEKIIDKYYKFFGYLTNDLIYAVEINNKSFFSFIIPFFQEIKTNQKLSIDLNEFFLIEKDRNDKFKCDHPNGFNYLIKKVIKLIKEDSYFFEHILFLPIYFFKYTNFKNYYYECFKLLNNEIWMNNLNYEKSNYLVANSLKNENYRDIFKNSCNMIYTNIKNFRFEINQNKKNNKIFENLVDIQEPLLQNCIYCICESLKTGNRDSIDYFLDLLFNFCKVFEVYYDENENYCFSDVRKNFLTYNNYNSNCSENSLINDFYEKDNYENEVKNKKENEKNEYKKFIEKYISNSALNNFTIDISYILFEILSKKYNEYLQSNKNNENNNIFILDIIKKIINYKPILDITEYGNNYYNNDYKNIFLDSKNIIYSMIRLIINDTNSHYSNLYHNYFDSISLFFDKSLYATIMKIDEICYINNYFIILLLCSDNYYEIQDLKNEYILEKISKYILLSIKKISSNNINKVQSRINKLKNNISNIEYKQYEKYIKNVFSDINENTFNDNKQSIIEFFEKLQSELSEKRKEFIKEEIKKENEKFQQEKDQKFKEIKKIIKNSFTEEVETIKFYEKFNLKDKILNLQTNKYEYVFSASGLDKVDFINGINDNNSSFNLKQSLCYEFYKAFNSRIFAHLIDSIKDIEKEENISSKYFIDTYLEKENKDYVIITNSEGTENNIIFKTLRGIGAESHIEKSELYLENWINLKWYFKSVDFLPEDTVIIIPKDYISKIELNLESLNIDYKEMENNFITLLFSCFYDVEFNKDKKKDIKIFNIIYEDKND